MNNQNVGDLYLNDSLDKQSIDFQSKSTFKLFFGCIVKLNSEQLSLQINSLNTDNNSQWTEILETKFVHIKM
jgi:hypothetical protein